MKRILVAVIVVAAALAALGCGGTTGTSGEVVTTASANVDAGVAVDATVDEAAASDASLYTGEFDVSIAYADRELPDLQPAVVEEAGLPDCPPFLPVTITHGVRIPEPFPVAQTQLPAIWVDGGEDFAPDGSVCATYPWLGSVRADECVFISGAVPFARLPPCNWAAEAGTAMEGPGAMNSRYDNCIALYKCMMRTLCHLGNASSYAGGTPVTDCFCGIGVDTTVCQTNPQNGPCMNEEQAALEVPGTPAAAANQVLSNFLEEGTPTTFSRPGVSGSTLNYLMTDLVTSCLPDAGHP